MKNVTHKRFILPQDQKDKTPQNLLLTYLAKTPFADFFSVRVPMVIPQEARYEHHHIIAGTGHGKTQTIQSLILDDLKKVESGEATVIVIDSQTELIEKISSLKVFAKGEPLHGKLCLIDPTDTDFPISINIFDLGMKRIKKYSSSDQQRAVNTIIDLMEFVLSSLLDAAMTQKQSLLFRFCVRLMLHIPNATIHTFRELLERDGFEKYQQYIQTLPQAARSFFENQFNDKQFTDTKSQVLRRIYGILENQTLEQMMAQAESKLDLFTEINKPNVILVNTSVDFLQQKGTELLGRFFVAMILNVTQQRATMDKSKHSVFVYIDEFGDYASHADEKITTIFRQARKQNVGIIVAHQMLDDLSPKTLSALDANTSIKFAGGVSHGDLRTVAGMLRTEPSFIDEQRKGSFAVHIKNVSPNAISLSFPFGRLEKEPTMTEDEKVEVIAHIRRKYATRYVEVPQSEVPEDDFDHVDTNPS